MAITKKDILDYVRHTPYNTNIRVLEGLLTELESDSSLDTSDATAAATDILKDKTAYVNGQKVTGTITSVNAQTITPTTTDQTVNGNVFLAGAITVAGDANLLAENIKSGVTIFGVTGTYTGEEEA